MYVLIEVARASPTPSQDSQTSTQPSADTDTQSVPTSDVCTVLHF